jgi:hypothetical protein
MKWWVRGSRGGYTQVRLMMLSVRKELIILTGNTCFCDGCLLVYKERGKRNAKQNSKKIRYQRAGS